MTLNFPKEPFELNLPYGIKLKVKPLTTAGMLAAQAGARRRADKEVPKDDPERDGFYQAFLIYELAFRHALELEVQGTAAPVTEENLQTIMDLYPVGERFFHEFTLHQVVLNAAKNAYGVSASGTSSQAAAPATATDAEASTA